MTPQKLTTSAHDVFWLARYAHNKLAPLEAPLDARLQIVLDFGDKNPGVQAWLFHNTENHVVAYRSNLQTKQDVDRFVDTLPLEAGVSA